MWETKVKFDSMSNKDGTDYITFTVDDVSGRPIPFGDDYYKMTLTKYHPPKSLNANGYYWVLVNKLSEELSKEIPTSVARVHNLHLREMWNQILMTVDGTPKMEILPNTENAEKSVLEDLENHLMPVPPHIMNPIFTNSKGKEFRYYFVLRGVRSMDTKEMSRLIDICIQDCIDVGNIETKTPRELEELEGYEKQFNNR